MDCDFERLTAVYTIAAGLIGLIGWILGRRKERRALQPIITLHGNRLEIQNRSDSELIVARIDADTRLGYRNFAQDEYGEQGVPAFESAPLALDWLIGPLSSASFGLWVEGPAGSEIELTLETPDRRIETSRRAIKREPQ